MALITKVGHLLTEDGLSWDEDKLQQVFNDSGAKEVRQIVTGGTGLSDYLAWNHTKNGVYSVRSGYHMMMALRRSRTGQPGSSGSVALHQAWLAIWATNVPNKAKFHMWWIIRNGLAVGKELSRRKIKMGVVCTACGREE